MILNALTVDVEDYFHVSGFANEIDPSDWDNYQPRVENNTHRMLDILDEYARKATFFVLGWVAEKHPQLVKEIADRGHEVGCHGYGHGLVYDQTPEKFRAETVRAKSTLEDTAQQSVSGYRAASFSITAESAWALDILAKLGFVYDSSIFPTAHDRYGMPGARAFPHGLTTSSGQKLVEFPLSTIKLLGYRFPVGGGGYFRLYPYVFTRAALRHINHREQQPFVFYLHPWEIDPDQPRINGSVLSRFRHYNNLDVCEGRLTRLLKDFQFGTVREVLSDLQLLSPEESRGH